MLRLKGGRTVIVVMAVTVGLLSLLPIGYLFFAGMSWDDIQTLFTYPSTADRIINTVALTLTISVLSIVLGVGAAILVVRTNVRARRLLTVLFAMPLAIPGFVSAYAAYSANLMFAPKLDIATSFAGAAIIMSLSLYPYVFLACVVAVRNVDPAQEEVAKSLRTRPGAVFWRVTVPQLRPAVAGSVIIVALHVLSEYGAMVQLRQRTLTTTIMSDMIDYGDYQSARSLSLLLAGLAFLFLIGGLLFSGRPYAQKVGSQTVRPPGVTSLGRGRTPILALCLLVPLAALGPTVYMTLYGLFAPHRQSVARWTEVLQATGATLGFAVWAGIIATALALPVSWWVSRRPSFWSNLTERSVWLAHAVPAAILALALVFLATRLVPGLYKTAALLVIAYVILYLPLAVANQRVGLQAAFVRYDEAAASLGSPVWQRMTRVSLPLALPGIATGALLVALDASKELTTTLMLLPFNVQTLSTGLWATTNGESLDFAAAAPYALMLVALGSLPVYLISRRVLRFVT